MTGAGRSRLGSLVLPGSAPPLAALIVTKPPKPLHGSAHFWFVVLPVIAITSLAALLLIGLRAVLAPWRTRRKRRSYRHGLRPGDSLLPGQSLYSPDGLTRFTLTPDGNMITYVDGRKDICDTGTGNLGQPRRLTLDRDSWLILQDVNNRELWKRGQEEAVLRYRTIPMWWCCIRPRVRQALYGGQISS